MKTENINLAEKVDTVKTAFCITPAGLITYDEKGGTVMLLDAGPDSHKVISSFKIDYGNGPHWSSPVHWAPICSSPAWATTPSGCWWRPS